MSQVQTFAQLKDLIRQLGMAFNYPANFTTNERVFWFVAEEQAKMMLREVGPVDQLSDVLFHGQKRMSKKLVEQWLETLDKNYDLIGAINYFHNS